MQDTEGITGQIALNFKHKNSEELTAVRLRFEEGEWNIFPLVDTIRLVKGFVATKVDDSQAEYHFYPIHDSDEECKEVTHEDFESWYDALQSFRSNEGTVIYKIRIPRRLLMGFAVHPQREAHVINLRDFGRTWRDLNTIIAADDGDRLN